MRYPSPVPADTVQSDLGEYNQCQSMLLMLYEHNLPGHPDEFLAYRILYMLHTKNKSGAWIHRARRSS